MATASEDLEGEISKLKTNSELSKRILSGVIIIPTCVLIAYINGWIFSLFIGVILTISIWEYFSLFKGKSYELNGVLLLSSPVVFCLAQHLYLYPFPIVFALFMLLVALAIFYSVWQYEQGQENALLNFGFTVAGITFIALLGSFLVALRNLPQGFYWTFLTIPAISAADIGAYFVGSRFGKHKLAPRTSPHKTWEGYWGGVVCAVVYSVVFSYFVQPHVPNLSIVEGGLLGLVLGAISPISDLFESMLKRYLQVKDTSQLIPGHGGMLDRVDTWLIGGVASYYLVLLIQ